MPFPRGGAQDKSGEVDRKEFRTTVLNTIDPKGEKYTEAQMNSLFDSFDKDGSGQVSCDVAPLCPRERS